MHVSRLIHLHRLSGSRRRFKDRSAHLQVCMHLEIPTHLHSHSYNTFARGTLTHSLTHSHTHARTLTDSLTLGHSVTQSLTQSLTHSITHTLNHSLTQTHTLTLTLTPPATRPMPRASRNPSGTCLSGGPRTCSTPRARASS